MASSISNTSPKSPAVRADRFGTLGAVTARAQTLATYVFFGVLAGAPLPYGSHSLGAESLWGALLSLALLFLSPVGLGRAQLAILGGFFVILCAYTFVIFEQVTEGPLFVPVAQIWAAAAKLGIASIATAAAVHNGPILSLGPTLVSALAFCLGVVVGSDGKKARTILAVVGVSGALYGIYGIIWGTLEPGTILGREREEYVGVVLGTFINRNTAATYFASCAVIWLLLLCENLKYKSKARGVSTGAMGRNVSYDRLRLFGESAAFFVCMLAMFMTNSRAGILFGLLGMGTAVTMLFFQQLKRMASKIKSIVLFLGAMISLFVILGGAINHRFDKEGFSDGGRVAVYQATLRIISDHPLFGIGLGGFGDVFPSYRSAPPSIWGIWDMAHSTPLEIAAELGLPLAMLLSLAVMMSIFLLARGFYVRQRDRIIPLIAFTVAGIGATHSCVDFSLQIPGYAIVFMALLGTGLAQSFRSETRVERHIPSKDNLSGRDGTADRTD